MVGFGATPWGGYPTGDLRRVGGWEASSRDIIVDLLICPATIRTRVTRLGGWGSKGGWVVRY